MKDLNRETVEAKYHDMGLETRYVEDGPGEVYEPHRHAGVHLFTLDGSARIRLDDTEWREVLPGDEVSIADDQLHEAVAGSNGWAYIFATTVEEMQRQGL